MTLRLPGDNGQTIRAILWANAGDVTHDPEWIKVWSSHDGSNFQLRDVLNLTSLRGSSAVTVLPLTGDPDNWRAMPLTEENAIAAMPAKGLPGNLDTRSEVRANFWRVNPGGIAHASMPRTIGLCTTQDCTNCSATASEPRSLFLWRSEPLDLAAFPPPSTFA